MNPIHLRNTPPPLETFDHAGLLAFIASWLRPERYLELGVRTGHSLAAVMGYCEEVYAVDINPFELRGKELSDNVVQFILSTDDFFDALPDGIMFDMVFIDAAHESEQVKKDFINVLPLVIEDGLIFLHDTYPYSDEMTKPYLCNDCWKAAEWIKQNIDVEIITLPFNPGVSIIKNIKRNKQLIWY